MEQQYNPIRSVDGAQIRVPSAYEYLLEDVSAADAGRTEDTKMHKMMLGQLVRLNMTWNNISIADAAALLQAFNPEYITVEYLDLKEGDYKTNVFYVGNRKAPVYNTKLGIVSSLSFGIIQQTGD